MEARATSLIAVRHAKYKDETLTDEGVAIQTEMSKRLKAEGWSADKIVTSPLTRAVQTATILQEHLGGAIQKEPALNTFDDETVLSHIKPEQTTLLVGHDPTLAAFLNHLLGRAQFTGLTKSAAAILNFPGDIAWSRAELIAYYQMG